MVSICCLVLPDVSSTFVLRYFDALRRAARLEAIVHQHLPIFHTEHCVFCRFLSDGNSYLDCGHPCESNSVHLRDGSGKDHLVLADEGCRNTVFNAQAQSGEHATFFSYTVATLFLNARTGRASLSWNFCAAARRKDSLHVN